MQKRLSVSSTPIISCPTSLLSTCCLRVECLVVRTFWRCLNIALDSLSYVVIYFLYTAFRNSVFTAAHVPTEARANLTPTPLRFASFTLLLPPCTTHHSP